MLTVLNYFISHTTSRLGAFTFLSLTRNIFWSCKLPRIVACQTHRTTQDKYMAIQRVDYYNNEHAETHKTLLYNIIAIIIKAQGNGWKLVVLGQIHKAGSVLDQPHSN